MESYVKGKIPQIIFGSKSAQKVSGLLKKYEIKKCLLVTGHHVVRHSITQNVIKALSFEGIHCDVFDRVTPEPTDTLCLEIAYEIIANEYDCVLGIGGGSPMDAAKAATLIAGIPENISDLHEYGKTGCRMKEVWKRPCMLVLIPTTSGTGAETTAGAVITSTMHGMKFSFGNSNISADIAVIDPEFTAGMSAAATVCGGIDALAHTIEILVGTANNEYTNQILFLCLKKIWAWLPVAVKEPENLKAREQMSWAAHNALANGGVPNGHAFAHAIGALYHITHGNACAMVLPTVVRHFAHYAQNNIQKMAEIMGITATGDAVKDADAVANAIHVFCQELGLDTLQKIFAEKGYCDNCQEFTEKMIPLVMDDFKSREWMPPIHTGNYKEKIGKICEAIYAEK